MAFYTPEMAAHFVGLYSQLLSPKQGKELGKAGRFLCTLVEKRIAEIERAKDETLEELFDKVLPRVLGTESFPPPPVPANHLAIEYFYGSHLAALTETESAKREEYYTTAYRIEQQIARENIKKNQLDNIFSSVLRTATLNYFLAAAHFLYSKKPEKERCADTRFRLQQAHLRYAGLEKLLKRFAAAPTLTPTHKDYIIELNYSSYDKKESRRKYRELKRKEPEMVRDIKRAAKASIYGAFDVIHCLDFSAQTSGKEDLYRPRDLIKRIKKTFCRKRDLDLPRPRDLIDPLLRQLFVQFFSQEPHLKAQNEVLHQEALFGLMRCYALKGNYRGLMRAGNKLEKIANDPAALSLEGTTVSAHRIELEAQEKKTRLGKCLPFVPETPEMVKQEIEQFISAHEYASKVLVMRSPFFGQQEIGRNVDSQKLQAA